MLDMEKAISCLTDIENIMIARQEICPREELQYWIELQEGVADAIAMLKEQQEQIDRLLEESASNAEMAEGLKELLKDRKTQANGIL